MGKSSIPLQEAVRILEGIAPPVLAESWDNVGLLVEPATARPISTILLTIDLTAAVLDEAVATGADLVVAYHPPLFTPLTRVVQSDPRGRLLARLLAAGIAVYSPHTALDSAPGGVNDWLADAFPAGLRRALAWPNARVALGAQDVAARVGQGRGIVLSEPAPLSTLISSLKRHLGVRTLRVARHERHRSNLVETIALCAGAGGDVIGASGADLLVTGEMSHHKVLAALAAGASVVLSEHSHTERGFLPVLATRLSEACGVRVVVALADRDPLESN